MFEFIASFFYVLVYSATILDKRAPSNIFGYAIGIVFALATMAIGSQTGACLNPIRAIGPQIIAGDFTYIYLYTLSNIFGGLFAGFYYDFFLKDIESLQNIFEIIHSLHFVFTLSLKRGSCSQKTIFT